METTDVDWGAFTPYAGPNLWLRARLEIVHAINTSQCSDDRHWHEARLSGFTLIARSVLGDDGHGALVMDCDSFYLSQGVDRSMCGGVWLSGLGPQESALGEWRKLHQWAEGACAHCAASIAACKSDPMKCCPRCEHPMMMTL